MKALDEMNADERQRYLDSLESKELARLKAELSGVLEPHSVDRVLESMFALVNRRVIEGLKPMVVQFGEMIGESIGTLLHGRAGPFYVEEWTYGDWIGLASGTAWLEPNIRFRLHFASKSSLEICFDANREENEVSIKPEGEQAACIYLGFQTVSRYIPLEIELGQGQEPTDSILFQMHVSQTWTSPKEPVLRMDYAVFQKRGHSGSKG